MPTIDKFVRDNIGKKCEEIGTVSMTCFPIDNLIATRPFLSRKRLSGKRRRSGQLNPHIVSIHNQGFVVDGHHKVRRAQELGNSYIYSKVLTTTDSQLTEVLCRLGANLVRDLEVK